MTNIEKFVARVRGKRLYHFTDASNIDSIKQFGLLPTRELVARGIAAVTGGDDDSLGIDRYKGFDAYVRLSFCHSHPMSQIALERGSITKVRVLSICPTVLLREGVLIADRVATANEAKIAPADEIIDEFDFQAAYAFLNWLVPEYWARRNAVEKWETLIPGAITTDLIRGL